MYRIKLSNACKTALLTGLMLMVGSVVSSELATAAIREMLPGARFGGGYRCPSMCLDIERPRQALLIPESNILLTAAASPTFLFHLPAGYRQNATVEFSLLNADRETLYSAKSETNDIAGIVRIELSNLDEPLALDLEQNYRWFITINCVQDNGNKPYDAYGNVQRTQVNDSLSEILNAEPSLSQVQQLEAAGLWSDALIRLDTLRRTQPNNADVLSQWRRMLTEVGLASVANEVPIERVFSESSSVTIRSQHAHRSAVN